MLQLKLPQAMALPSAPDQDRWSMSTTRGTSKEEEDDACGNPASSYSVNSTPAAPLVPNSGGGATMDDDLQVFDETL